MIALVIKRTYFEYIFLGLTLIFLGEKKSMKKKILILFGGCSTEYDVSLQSAYAVIQAVNQEKYDLYLCGISRQGDAYLFEDDISLIPEDKWLKGNIAPATIAMSRSVHGLYVYRNGKAESIRIDAAFPVLHGKNGEDGTVQGLCQLAGIPIVGCTMQPSVIGMDKDLAHKLVEDAGIRVPHSVLLNKAEETKKFAEEICRIGFPLFVKPVRAGSSFGITKVLRKEDLQEAVEAAFEHDAEVILEENIEGFEVGCAVVGNEELIIGRVDEIELSRGFFDYTEKYTLKTSAIHMPARIDGETEKRIQETALKIYRALGCCGFTRVDMFLTDKKEIVFNEVNTIPGFTSHSRFPNMLKGIGYTFEEIVDKLISLAR